MNDPSPQIDDINPPDCDAKCAALQERHKRSILSPGGCLRTVVKKAVLGGMGKQYHLVSLSSFSAECSLSNYNDYLHVNDKVFA